MSHQVLYRKYRPRDFSEVVGQEHVVRPIANAIRMGKVAHAYLFSGPRGVGKTTIARLIAKALNCVGGEKPCNACDPCIAFNEGRAFDLIEIDAASNRGIDEIRELRESVRFAPAGGGKKTYIIDECHMLTKEAFNALLKTLEEPPAHAVFVLATTEFDKVLPTIVSRTQHYAFRKPKASEIVSRLQHIASREGIALENHAAYALASVAEGSLRDAESILGKIVSVEDKKITEEEVSEILGVPRRALTREMLASVGVRDAQRALLAVDELQEGGYEHEYAAKVLIQYLRNMLLLRVDPKFSEIIAAEMSEEDIVFLKEEGAHFPDLRIKHALATLINAFENFKRSPIPQLPLELALLEIIQKE